MKDITSVGCFCCILIKENDEIYRVFWIKIFDEMYFYAFALIFLRVLGDIKSFGSVNLGKFNRVARVTLCLWLNSGLKWI